MTWSLKQDIADREQRKKDNPIRFFFKEGLPMWLRLQKMSYIERPIYWFKSFVLRKDHLLDLRNGPCYGEFGDWGGYKWGFLSGKDTLEVSCFKALERHINWIGGLEGLDKHIDMLRDVCTRSPNPHDIQHLNNAREIKTIYIFFASELPSLHEQRDMMNLETHSIEDINSFDQMIEDGITAKLTTLIRLRKVLQ